MYDDSFRETSSGHGSSGLDRKNPSMTLLSRTVIVTPEHAVTSVTQTASRTRLDAGCQIGELKLGIICSAAVSTRWSHVSRASGFRTSGEDSGIGWCFCSECSAASGGGRNDCFADPLTFDPGRLTNSRAIPRGPCFRRFFTMTGASSGGEAAGGGLGAGLTGISIGCGLSTFVADDGIFSDSAGDWECC